MTQIMYAFMVYTLLLNVNFIPGSERFCHAFFGHGGDRVKNSEGRNNSAKCVKEEISDQE